MKSFTITKPTRKQIIGLLIMAAVIISTLITTQFYKGWRYSSLAINVTAIGYILIVGFSIIDKKYWLMVVLLPLWFFATMPGSDWVNIEISNNSPDPCQTNLMILSDGRTKDFSIPPNDSKTIIAPWANEFILTYQYPNQPKQGKYLQRPAKKSSIKTKLNEQTTKPKGKDK